MVRNNLGAALLIGGRHEEGVAMLEEVNWDCGGDAITIMQPFFPMTISRDPSRPIQTTFVALHLAPLHVW